MPRQAEEDLGASRSQMSAHPPTIPVFAYPAEILFNALEREGHKNIITVFNPYDFPILYRILCTNPELFTLRDAEGSVSENHTLDIIVRLTPQVPTDSESPPLKSKFRVQIYDARSKQPLGRRDLVARVLYTRAEPPTPQRRDHGGSSSSTASRADRDRERDPQSPSSTSNDRDEGGGGGGGYGGPHHLNYVAIVTGIICVFALFLPSDKEPSPSFPSYLHLTQTQRLVLAYTLGLVTTSILRYA